MTEQELYAAINSLARRVVGSRSTRQLVTNNITTTNVTTNVTDGVARFAPDDEVVLASGTGGASGTLDVSSYVGDANYAIIRYWLSTPGDSTPVSIQVRPDSGSGYTTPVQIRSTSNESDNDNTELTYLSGSKTFDYLMTDAANTTDWAITLLGYA